MPDFKGILIWKFTGSNFTYNNFEPLTSSGVNFTNHIVQSADMSAVLGSFVLAKLTPVVNFIIIL